MTCFALKSPLFESHTDILTLSLSLSAAATLFSVNFNDVSIITARQRTLLMKILIYVYIICDRPFSHMGQEYPFYDCHRFFYLGLLVSFYDKIAVSNCPSLLYEPPHDDDDDNNNNNNNNNFIS